MPRVNLLGGTYLARSLIADAQECLNLYPEKNPEDASAPYTHQLTPGLTQLALATTAGVARGLYTATNGGLYYVCGNNVYFISQNWALTLLGALNDNLTTPVGMNDNGNVLVIVNGTGVASGGTGPGPGWAINLQTGIVGQPVAGTVTNAGSPGEGGSVSAGTITAAGSGTLNGSFGNVAFTNGSGTGATAQSVTVANPIINGTYVTYVTVTTTVPHGLSAGDTVTVAGFTGTYGYNYNGTFTVVAPGLSATVFSYLPHDDSLPTGFTGPGTLILGGTGEVVAVTPSGNGTGYDAGDVLGLNLAGLTGFQYTVAAYGIGVVNGSYNAVALTGGHGTGAQGNFLVAGGVVEDFSLVAGVGTGYQVGDVLSTTLVPGLAGFSLKLTVVGAALNAFAAIVDPNFLGGTNVGVLDTFMVMNQPKTSQWQSSLSNITFAELTGVPGQPLFGTIIAAGTGGTAASYANVPLLNGSGTGATATIKVSNGVITSVTLTDGGTGYTSAPVVTASGGGGSGAIITAQINAAGAVTSLTIINGGSGYSGPTLAFSGGGGSSAAATAIATNGLVTSVTLNSVGLTYNAGDILIAQTTGVPTNFQYELIEVNAPAFDPLYVASKTGYPDTLSTLIVLHREIWLLGSYVSTEVWYDAGGSAFPFQIMPGVFLQHGCIAPYSVASHDLVTFWLSIDAAGACTVFMGTGYEARRISTYAIEKILSGFLSGANPPGVSDAIGMVYKQQDHIFYVLTFPTADATLVFDLGEQLWHTRGWLDAQGKLHRIRANCMAFAYNTNICADWQTGTIYSLDLSNYTDAGAPIVRRRAFPHLIVDGNRVSYDALRLDIDCGSGVASAPAYAPQVTLEYSDDRGKTFTKAPPQSLGAQGQYLVQPQWRQLGMARDRVFRVSWSDATFTALQGAWLNTTQAET